LTEAISANTLAKKNTAKSLITYNAKVKATAAAKKNEAKNAADKKIWTDAVTAESDAKTAHTDDYAKQDKTEDKVKMLTNWIQFGD